MSLANGSAAAELRSDIMDAKDRTNDLNDPPDEILHSIATCLNPASLGNFGRCSKGCRPNSQFVLYRDIHLDSQDDAVLLANSVKTRYLAELTRSLEADYTDSDSCESDSAGKFIEFCHSVMSSTPSLSAECVTNRDPGSSIYGDRLEIRDERQNRERVSALLGVSLQELNDLLLKEVDDISTLMDEGGCCITPPVLCVVLAWRRRLR